MTEKQLPTVFIKEAGEISFAVEPRSAIAHLDEERKPLSIEKLTSARYRLLWSSPSKNGKLQYIKA